MAKAISSTKPSYLKAGSSIYRLIPAASRSHYGQFHTSLGGEPYAYQRKKADEAWLVVSDWNGQTLGVLEKAYEEWGFQKVKNHEQAPQWLRSQMDGSVGWTIYNLSSRIYSGKTAEAALAEGLGNRTRSPADLQREIDEFREKSWGGK